MSYANPAAAAEPFRSAATGKLRKFNAMVF